jgi:hypothetical protein
MKPYIYWTGPSLREFIRQVNAGPVDRIEFHPDGAHSTIVVVPAAESDGTLRTLDPPINEAFVCPGSPLCH